MKCFKRRPEPFAGSYPYQKAIISIHFSYDFFYRWQDFLLAECEEGSGSKVLEETCRTLKTADAIEAKLRDRFLIGANKAYAITRLTKKAHFILVTGLDRQLAKDMLFDGAVDTVEEALELAKQYVGDDVHYILMPTGSLTVPLYRPE